MPIIERSSYPGPPAYQFNAHLQTICPNLMRRIKPPYARERLELADGDFLDLDWIRKGSDRLVVISHGLEGSSQRAYVAGAASLFARRGWDVLAWNCRSCSGELNRLPRLYHHGDIDDLGRVIEHALASKAYADLVLLGYSMGGSMTLKYLGVHGPDVPAMVRAGIAFSTPCDLKASASTLELRSNRFYRNRFLKSLRRKMEAKSDALPPEIDLGRFDAISSWNDFDRYFSAPINGYASPDEFYAEASASRFLDGTAVPVLIVNAMNDPLLTRACTPHALAEGHPLVHVETPRAGGHVGFGLPGRRRVWSEHRALQFAEAHLPGAPLRRIA